MSVCCEFCVLSGRDLCVGLITRPEESYRVCVSNKCDPEATKREAMPRKRVEAAPQLF
jgi:hypothetical protein